MKNPFNRTPRRKNISGDVGQVPKSESPASVFVTSGPPDPPRNRFVPSRIFTLGGQHDEALASDRKNFTPARYRAVRSVSRSYEHRSSPPRVVRQQLEDARKIATASLFNPLPLPNPRRSAVPCPSPSNNILSIAPVFRLDAASIALYLRAVLVACTCLCTHLNILYAPRQYARAHKQPRVARDSGVSRDGRAGAPLVFNFLERRATRGTSVCSVACIKVTLRANHAA